MNEQDIKVVKMKEWLRHDGIVDMLEYMLSEAKSGNLIGAAGVFLIGEQGPDKGPSLGIMKTDNMDDNVFTVVGALEKIKLQLLLDVEAE